MDRSYQEKLDIFERWIAWFFGNKPYVSVFLTWISWTWLYNCFFRLMISDTQKDLMRAAFRAGYKAGVSEVNKDYYDSDFFYWLEKNDKTL